VAIPESSECTSSMGEPGTPIARPRLKEGYRAVGQYQRGGCGWRLR
jgi:hypothetical protein